MGWDEMDPMSDDVWCILYLGGRRWSRGCTLWIILLYDSWVRYCPATTACVYVYWRSTRFDIIGRYGRVRWDRKTVELRLAIQTVIIKVIHWWIIGGCRFVWIKKHPEIANYKLSWPFDNSIVSTRIEVVYHHHVNDWTTWLCHRAAAVTRWESSES